ncbi:hypothetical protein WN51_14259 [Melipona quadrifasciata]|uniref:Uncharacterized protein n=1 Tax=Melipona quadrifasciata TaxID=166423 RepID=A0A0M9A199_9HYME|nr:hypothetical protein WN51_14259 [Melipona quadrifasciata]
MTLMQRKLLVDLGHNFYSNEARLASTIIAHICPQKIVEPFCRKYYTGCSKKGTHADATTMRCQTLIKPPTCTQFGRFGSKRPRQSQLERNLSNYIFYTFSNPSRVDNLENLQPVRYLRESLERRLLRTQMFRFANWTVAKRASQRTAVADHEFESGDDGLMLNVNFKVHCVIEPVSAALGESIFPTFFRLQRFPLDAETCGFPTAEFRQIADSECFTAAKQARSEIFMPRKVALDAESQQILSKSNAMVAQMDHRTAPLLGEIMTDVTCKLRRVLKALNVEDRTLGITPLIDFRSVYPGETGELDEVVELVYIYIRYFIRTCTELQLKLDTKLKEKFIKVSIRPLQTTPST